jgi:hypothetical protein
MCDFIKLLISNTVILTVIDTLLRVTVFKKMESNIEFGKDNKLEKLKNSLTKDIQIFEKEKESLAAILSLFCKMSIQISDSFIPEENRYLLIEESDIDTLELKIQEYILYVNDTNIRMIDLLLQVLRTNSTFIIKVTGENDFSFASEDLPLFNYLFKKLQILFKEQLFEKNMDENQEVDGLCISYFITALSQDDLIDKKIIEKYSYKYIPISLATENIKKNKKNVIEILIQLKNKIEDSGENSNYRYSQIKKIDEYIEILKKRRTKVST